MSYFQKIALVITIIGAVNWGIIGLFDYDTVAYIFGDMTFMTRTVYSLVGLAGLINIGLLTVPSRDY